jgi:hypothetical protein
LGLTLFGWFVSFYLSIFYDENIIFDLRHFDLLPIFQEHNWDFKRTYRHPRNTTTYGGV